jgi:SOS-response transcriptional repressor LexA
MLNGMEVETFGQRLKRLRLARGLSQRKLAAAVSLTNGTISQAESEGLWVGQLPSYDIMKRLARALGVTPEILAGAEEEQKRPRKRYTLAQILHNIGAYPVVDTTIALDQEVSAGSRKGGHIPQGLEGVEVLPKVNGEQLYALRVTGDCMVPEVKPGEVVHFDPARPAEDGDLVVAAKDGERALVKWLDQRGTVQYLLPLNGDPILIDDSIEVLGVVENIVRKAPRRTTKNKKAKPVSPQQRALINEPVADD